MTLTWLAGRTDGTYYYAEDLHSPLDHPRVHRSNVVAEIGQDQTWSVVARDWVPSRAVWDYLLGTGEGALREIAESEAQALIQARQAGYDL